MAAVSEVLINFGRKIIELVPKLSLIVAAIGLCLMAGLVIGEVIARNFLHFGIPFAVEGVEYLIPVVGIIGGVYTMRKGRHVKADILLRLLPIRLGQWFVMLGYIMGLGYLIILSLYVTQMGIISIEKGYYYQSSVKTPIGYPQLVLAMGLWLLSWQTLVEIVRKCRHIFTSYK